MTAKIFCTTVILYVFMKFTLSPEIPLYHCLLAMCDQSGGFERPCRVTSDTKRQENTFRENVKISDKYLLLILH
jgi:hypothetical protein